MKDIMSDIQFSANEEIINVALEKAREEEEKLQKEKLKGKEWQARGEALHKSWDPEKRDKFLNAILRRKGNFHSGCAICRKVGEILVCCPDCKQYLCWSCDDQFHFYNPFHARVFKGDDFKTEQLQPTEFLNERGEKFEKSMNIILN